MFQDLREAQSVFHDILKKGETLIWVGKPKQGFVMKPSDRYLIPFSIFWCGFVFMWEYITWNMSDGFPIMPIFGIPFILVGLYLVVGRFFMDNSIRKNTFYALTDKRILVRTGVWNTSVDIYRFDDIQHIQFKEKADGSGTVLLTPSGITLPDAMGKGKAIIPAGTVQFEFIEEVKTVFLLLQEKMDTRSATA